MDNAKDGWMEGSIRDSDRRGAVSLRGCQAASCTQDQQGRWMRCRRGEVPCPGGSVETGMILGCQTRRLHTSESSVAFAWGRSTVGARYKGARRYGRWHVRRGHKHVRWHARRGHKQARAMAHARRGHVQWHEDRPQARAMACDGPQARMDLQG